jgi:hypothetical protein
MLPRSHFVSETWRLGLSERLDDGKALRDQQEG